MLALSATLWHGDDRFASKPFKCRRICLKWRVLKMFDLKNGECLTPERSPVTFRHGSSSHSALVVVQRPHGTQQYYQTEKSARGRNSNPLRGRLTPLAKALPCMFNALFVRGRSSAYTRSLANATHAWTRVWSRGRWIVNASPVTHGGFFSGTQTSRSDDVGRSFADRRNNPSCARLRPILRRRRKIVSGTQNVSADDEIAWQTKRTTLDWLSGGDATTPALDSVFIRPSPGLVKHLAFNGTRHGVWRPPQPMYNDRSRLSFK